MVDTEDSSNMNSKNFLRFIRDNRFLDMHGQTEDTKLSLILLNRPYHKSTLIDLFQKASHVVCADGATNRLYNTFTDD